MKRREKHNKMVGLVYTDKIIISKMLELDLFDDIEYKYFKNFIKRQSIYHKINIEDFGQDELGYEKVIFRFKIPQSKVDGKVLFKRFAVEKNFNCDSQYAQKVHDLYVATTEDEEED